MREDGDMKEKNVGITGVDIAEKGGSVTTTIILERVTVGKPPSGTQGRVDTRKGKDVYILIESTANMEEIACIHTELI